METCKASWTLGSVPCLILQAKASHVAELKGKKLCVTSSGRTFKYYMAKCLDARVGEERVL